MTGTDNAGSTLHFRWVRGVVLLGLAATPVGEVPDGVAAVAARARLRPTARPPL